MKFLTGALTAALLVSGAAVAPVALAATGLFATEAAAQQACSSDEVVWIDLDRGRFYHKAQTAFGKSSNGGFACMKAAHAQYREGHE